VSARIEEAVGVVYEAEQDGDGLFRAVEAWGKVVLGHPALLRSGNSVRMAPFLHRQTAQYSSRYSSSRPTHQVPLRIHPFARISAALIGSAYDLPTLVGAAGIKALPNKTRARHVGPSHQRHWRCPKASSPRSISFNVAIVVKSLAIDSVSNRVSGCRARATHDWRSRRRGHTIGTRLA
jgi:hypothetical protein